jgi:hypothetical protein
MKKMSKTNEQQPAHQVVADGEVIYEGDDWQEAFLEAGKHPEYTTIIHLQDGEPGAVLGPPLHHPQTPS